VSPPRSGPRPSRLNAALDQEGGWVDESANAARQALDELRQHPLPEPRAYVLMLVEAAVVSGVSSVHVDCIDGVLVVELGPLLFRREELARLFISPLGPISGGEDSYRRAPDADEQAALRVRTLQKLAVGCAAAQSLEPTGILIESIDRSGKGLRWRSTPIRPEGAVFDVEGEWPGTRIEIGGVVGERDRDLLRERCRASHYPIHLGDERISKGPEVAMLGGFVGARERGRWSPKVQLRRIVDAQGRTIGHAGRSRDPDARTARVIVLCNGVEIETIELPEGRDHFVAVVELDLPRDISQTRLQRGPELAAMLAAVQRRTRGSPRPPPISRTSRPDAEIHGVAAGSALVDPVGSVVIRGILAVLFVLGYALYEVLTSK
jgi:hypothetical protein